jgi:phosphoglycerate dehydrogenase-like enzyme
MKLAVLNKVHLLEDARQKINEIVASAIEFPNVETYDEEVLIQRTNGAEVVLVKPSTPLTRRYFESCPSVKYVLVCGTSMERIDKEYAKDSGVIIDNVANYSDHPPAEFIMMQITYLFRGVGQCQWRSVPHEVMGKRMGIIGLGALGQAIAQLALAYKMTGMHM